MAQTIDPQHINSSRNKIYIVDGSGYIFRAFFAVQALSTKEGFPTNALFGFTRMLLRLLTEADSEHVVVVFDAGRETFRTEMYPEYKANRDECPEDLLKQMPYFRELCRALGLLILEERGFEADDLIAALTDRLRSGEKEIVIVTGDKDLMQLVDDRVTIWDTMRDRRIGRTEVQEKFGVPPEKVVEVLGLMGDTSDNIPGVRGVGDKTAAQLIQLYGDVENVIAHVAELKENPQIRNRKKIAEQIELDVAQLRLSRQLVEVNRSAPVKFERDGSCQEMSCLNDTELVEALVRRPVDDEQLHALVSKFEFSSLIKDLNLSPKKSLPADESRRYHTVLRADFSAWLAKFKQQREYSIDLETTSLDFLQAKIVGFSFCWSDTEAFYIPVGHVERPEDQIGTDEVLKAIRDSLLDSTVRKIGQNIKFDAEILARHGVRMAGIAFDTMLAAYVLNPDRRSLSLGSLAHDYLGIGVIEYEDVVGDKLNFSEVGIAAATEYSAEDSHVAWLLWRKFAPLLDEANLRNLFETIEMPLLPVLAAMEDRGIGLDVDFLKKLSDEYEIHLTRIRAELYELAGGEFNVNSPKQLSEILFERLKIPTKGLKKTKTGISTDSSVLEQLSAVHPLPQKILDYRLLFKLKSTYIDALPEQVSPVTRRLHTRFNQTGTATGRLSSSDPNLQNIPIQSTEGRRIREAFVAADGRVLISADYSQIELRILAHMSGDASLKRLFKEDADIHAATAREILGLGPLFEVSSEQRRMGKTINFGLVYGMGAFRLGKELGIPMGVAQKYIENYFSRYPGVQGLFDRFEEEARTKGFVTTMFGRRRMITDIDTSGRDRGFAQRVAINAPIQGGAADLMKLAMIAVERRLADEKVGAEMLLQIHDELVIECDAGSRDRAITVVRECMEQVIELEVPLKVEVGSGRNWEEAHQ